MTTNLSARPADVLMDEPGPAGVLVDAHSVLLWQTCAYAEDLTVAARSRQPFIVERDAMLAFLHERLLPYLRREERQLPPTSLRDRHMTRLLLADHERLRADVANVAGSRTRVLLAVAVDELVDRLDRHLRREESWVTDPSLFGSDISGAG